MWVNIEKYMDPTVDGQNPAPVDMVNIPLFTGFHTSQVVQDFLHQQYWNTFSNTFQTKLVPSLSRPSELQPECFQSFAAPGASGT